MFAVVYTELRYVSVLYREMCYFSYPRTHQNALGSPTATWKEGTENHFHDGSGRTALRTPAFANGIYVVKMKQN